MTKPLFEEYDTVQSRAYSGVDTAIDRTAYRIAGGSTRNPEDLLRAALAVQSQAGARVVRYVDAMRGEGASWKRVAEVLFPPNEYGGENQDVANQGNTPEECAFYLVAPESQRGMMFEPSTTRWTCGGPAGCGERITDSGPFESHPDDNERGHAETCARHAAAVATWKRKNR